MSCLHTKGLIWWVLVLHTIALRNSHRMWGWKRWKRTKAWTGHPLKQRMANKQAVVLHVATKRKIPTQMSLNMFCVVISFATSALRCTSIWVQQINSQTATVWHIGFWTYTYLCFIQLADHIVLDWLWLTHNTKCLCTCTDRWPAALILQFYCLFHLNLCLYITISMAKSQITKDTLWYTYQKECISVGELYPMLFCTCSNKKKDELTHQSSDFILWPLLWLYCFWQLAHVITTMCWARFYIFAPGMFLTEPVFFFCHTWTVATESAPIIKGTCSLTTFDDTCL